MRKKLLILIFAILFLLPFKTEAISKKYEDKVAPIVKNESTEKRKVTLYLFHGQECPHCEEEREWLKTIERKYKDYLVIKKYEVWHNEDNQEKMKKVQEEFNIKEEGVPLTIIGEKSYIGYSESMSTPIENKIKEYIKGGNENKFKIPILGKVNAKKVSIPLVAVILGFIDGFNPCAMWILLFLINMLFNLKNRKRAWILGLTFLTVSGIIYFLSMLGINLIVGGINTVKILKVLIAAFILIAGILNLKKYFETRNEADGCTVVDAKKRKKITTRMKKILSTSSFPLALTGIIVLAASVNLIELACSLGFPVIFTEILNINHVEGMTKIIYLLIYIFFYMIDDIAVFSISMITLESTGITNKYNKLCTLISAIIMIVMGLLLLYKPEWLMLNF